VSYHGRFTPSRRPIIRFLPACFLCALAAAAAEDTLEPLKRAVADEAARKAAQDLPSRYRGIKLAIAPFRNDPDGIVAKSFQDALSGRGVFDVVEKSTIRELWEKITGADKDAPVTAAKAVELGTTIGAEAVLFGRVETLTVEDQRSFCDVKVRIVWAKDRDTAVRAGDGMFIGRYQSDLRKSMLSIPHFQVFMTDTDVFPRILIWCVALLIMPFLTLLARETLSQAAPIIPIGIVLLMTALDIGLAVLLMGFAVNSILKWVLLVGALAVSIVYNLFVLGKVAQLQLPGRD
jgi:hypothetical protein